MLIGPSSSPKGQGSTDEDEQAAIILYNAFRMGRKQGSQGPLISESYSQTVIENSETFKSFVIDMANKVYRQLVRIHRD